MSEWLKVMLEEIARKRNEAELARAEDARRAISQSAPPNAESPRTPG
jgi:hypothetical protein